MNVDDTVRHLRMVYESRMWDKKKYKLDTEERAYVEQGIWMIWELKKKNDRLIYENEMMKRKRAKDGFRQN